MLEEVKLTRLLFFYKGELDMWKLSRIRALKLGRSAVIYDFNIDRLSDKVSHIESLLKDYIK